MLSISLPSPVDATCLISPLLTWTLTSLGMRLHGPKRSVSVSKPTTGILPTGISSVFWGDAFTLLILKAFKSPAATSRSLPRRGRGEKKDPCRAQGVSLVVSVLLGSSYQGCRQGRTVRLLQAKAFASVARAEQCHDTWLR